MKHCIYKFSKIFFVGTIFTFMLQFPCYAFSQDAINSYNKGIEMTSREKYKKAIVHFQKAIEKEPEFVDAYYNLGILEEFRGNREKAIEVFEKAHKYKPEDYEIIYKLATLHYTTENLEQAEVYIKQIPPEDPHFKRIVEFMSDPGENIFSVSRKDDIEETKEETKEDVEKKLNGPDSCETLENNISEIKAPTGIAKDSEGNIYVADFSENSIIYISNDGEQKVIARKGLIKGPIGLAIDKYNNLYVANYDSDEIVLLPASGKAPKILPINVKKPYFLMVDDSGILYVSEQANNTVSKHKLIWKN